MNLCDACSQIINFLAMCVGVGLNFDSKLNVQPSLLGLAPLLYGDTDLIFGCGIIIASALTFCFGCLCLIPFD